MSGPAIDSTGRQEYVLRLVEGFIRIGLIALLATWCFHILQPFIPLIAWGVIIAVAVHPLHARFAQLLGERTGLSAAFITLFALSCLLVPTYVLLDSLTRSSLELYANIEAGKLSIPAPPETIQTWPLIGDKVHTLWSLAATNLEATLGKLEPQLQSLGAWIVHSVSGLGFNLLKFCLSIIIAGALLYKAEAGKLLAERLFARVTGRRHAEFVVLSRETVRSVALGVVGVAVIQSVLAGLGFVIASVPAAGLLAFLVLLLGIIQLPTILVFIPVCVWAYGNMSTTAASLLTAWCLAVGFSDNILKPIFFGRGVDIPMLVILIGAIGGMLYNGIIGLFVGAVVLSLGYKLFLAWLEME